MGMNFKLNLLAKPLPSELLLSAIDMRRIATRFSQNFSKLTTRVRASKLLSLKEKPENYNITHTHFLFSISSQFAYNTQCAKSYMVIFRFFLERNAITKT